MKKLIILLGLAVLFAAAVYGWKEFHRGQASSADLPVKETVTAKDLLAAFEADEAAATARYVGTTEQVIQVTGAIRSIDPSGPELTNVVLETGNELAGVVCEFKPAEVPKQWKTRDAVQLKGVCTGMLLDVLLVRCVAVE